MHFEDREKNIINNLWDLPKQRAVERGMFGKKYQEEDPITAM